MTTLAVGEAIVVEIHRAPVGGAGVALAALTGIVVGGRGAGVAATAVGEAIVAETH